MIQRYSSRKLHFLTSRKELFFILTDHWVTKRERVRISDPAQMISSTIPSVRAYQ